MGDDFVFVSAAADPYGNGQPAYFADGSPILARMSPPGVFFGWQYVDWQGRVIDLPDILSMPAPEPAPLVRSRQLDLRVALPEPERSRQLDLRVALPEPLVRSRQSDLWVALPEPEQLPLPLPPPRSPPDPAQMTFMALLEQSHQLNERVAQLVAEVRLIRADLTARTGEASRSTGEDTDAPMTPDPAQTKKKGETKDKFLARLAGMSDAELFDNSINNNSQLALRENPQGTKDELAYLRQLAIAYKKARRQQAQRRQ